MACVLILVLLCAEARHGVSATQLGRSAKSPMTVEEAEAKAAEDLIRQTRPPATLRGQTRPPRLPSDSFALLNVQLNAVAEDGLKATRDLKQKLDSFLTRF